MKTCLVVDDSLVTRLMLSELLRKIEPDTQVVQASCGKDAMDAIDQNSEIDFALIDFNMPGMNGLELADQLIASGRVGKIALLTANIQENLKSAALSKGLSYLNKPINEDVITEFVKSTAH